jgi:hypothetical protein
VTRAAERIEQGGWRRRRWSCRMLTPFKAAVDGNSAPIPCPAEHATKTTRPSRNGSSGVAVPPIEALQQKEIREVLDWVHERALAECGTNPGRTANKAREHRRAVLP